MSMKVLTCCLFLACAAHLNLNAQIIDREIPKEWEGLVEGGSFMDLFQPIPVQGSLTRDTWGTDNVIPRDVDNGIEDPEWSYWGGDIEISNDREYHLFVARWPENSSKGHAQWPNSTVVHAVSNNSIGPYKVKNTVGPGHNPEVFQLNDGRYVIYVIDGYYISKDINGPWEEHSFDFDPRGRPIIEG